MQNDLTISSIQLIYCMFSICGKTLFQFRSSWHLTSGIGAATTELELAWTLSTWRPIAWNPWLIITRKVYMISNESTVNFAERITLQKHQREVHEWCEKRPQMVACLEVLSGWPALFWGPADFISEHCSVNWKKNPRKGRGGVLITQDPKWHPPRGKNPESTPV